MRILLANYRYFVSGGPERYLFNASTALQARGHEIVPFSNDYTENVATPYSRYFVAAPGGRDAVYFREQRSTPGTVLKTLSRLVYASDVERAVLRLARDTKPDVAYVLHYLRKLSPALLVGLKKAGLPIVVRLSDYQMLCPQAHFLRGSAPCQDCMHGNLMPSIRHRCVHGSLGASLVNAAATRFHRLRGYFDLIDAFVVTNPFMQRVMLEAGYPEKRVRLIPTFVDAEAFQPTSPGGHGNYLAYVGRLEFIKGVHVLLEGFAHLKRTRPEVSWALKLAGTGESAYVASLRARAQKLDVADTVEFVGNLEKAALARFLAQAKLSIVPSLWYENLPNSLLESYACGTPVLASALGSLNDAVADGVTGFVFEAGNPQALAERLIFAWDHPELIASMSAGARRQAEERYSEAAHVPMLERLLSELASGRTPSPSLAR